MRGDWRCCLHESLLLPLSHQRPNFEPFSLPSHFHSIFVKWNFAHFFSHKICPNFNTLDGTIRQIWSNFKFEAFMYTKKGNDATIYNFDHSNSHGKNDPFIITIRGKMLFFYPFSQPHLTTLGGLICIDCSKFHKIETQLLNYLTVEHIRQRKRLKL